MLSYDGFAFMFLRTKWSGQFQKWEGDENGGTKSTEIEITSVRLWRKGCFCAPWKCVLQSLWKTV